MSVTAAADPARDDTDWLQDARYGVFMHFLPGDAAGLAGWRNSTSRRWRRQLEAMGAGYFVITLGQNSGYFNSPNAAYDKRTGYAPGERCATARSAARPPPGACSAKGIRLMLYLPCQTPNQDRRAQKAFGLRRGPEGPADRPGVRREVGGGDPGVVRPLRRQGVGLVVRRRLRARPLQRGHRPRLRRRPSSTATRRPSSRSIPASRWSATRRPRTTRPAN